MNDDMEKPQGPGRPRSERVSRAILKATLALMARDGWSGVTMEGIAERAGVGKAAVYRRWKNREAVLVAAVDSVVSEIRIPDTGAIRQDLEALMRQAVAVYRGPPGRVMPGLVSAMAEHDAVAIAVREGFLASRREALRSVLERGIERCELRADVDLELTLDFLGGPLFYRLLVTGGSLDDRLAEGTVDIMLRGIACPAQTPT